MSRKPAAVRVSSRTVAPVRIVNRPEAASVSVSRCSPPATPANTGPSTAGIVAACSSNEPRAAIATSCGTAARAESSRARPA